MTEQLSLSLFLGIGTTLLGIWYYPSWDLVLPFLGIGMNDPYLVMAKGLDNSMKP